MSQPLVLALLTFALVVPIPGAVALRVLGPRLSLAQMVAGVVVLCGASVLSVLVLAQSNITSLQVGNVTLLLPDTGDAPGPEGRSGPATEDWTGEDETFPDSSPVTPTVTLTGVTPTVELSPTLPLTPAPLTTEVTATRGEGEMTAPVVGRIGQVETTRSWHGLW
ncbi:MAG: hypothetical protein HC884_04695 [Chloroflexaceae bacterium]|nr:hypothetical protein [Chloroflexaceae bacterium]